MAEDYKLILLLISFSIIPFLTPSNIEGHNSLTFPGVIKMEHWVKMG